MRHLHGYDVHVITLPDRLLTLGGSGFAEVRGDRVQLYIGTHVPDALVPSVAADLITRMATAIPAQRPGAPGERDGRGHVDTPRPRL